jgi:hypothetical protein
MVITLGNDNVPVKRLQLKNAALPMAVTDVGMLNAVA